MNPFGRMSTKAKNLIANGMLAVSLLLVACGPRNGQPDPVLSEPPEYIAALSTALKVCDQVGMDQVCLGQGTVTVEPQANVRLEEFAQPGDVLALQGITGLQLAGAGSTEEWGIAVMRLQADFNDPEKYLTIVVMGGTQLSNIQIAMEDLPPLTFAGGEGTAESAPATDPVIFEPVQGFNFSSTPMSDDPSAPPNGLLMWTPLGDETASIILNGAAVTLGSTALVQSPPGEQMTIAMFEGTTLVTDADGGAGFAEGGTQISIAIDPQSGPIRDPRAEAVVHAVAQYQPDPLDPQAEAVAHVVAQNPPEVLNPRAEAIVHAVEQYIILTNPRAEAIARAVDQYPHEVAKDIKIRYQRALNRCTDAENPQPRYVYNVLYFYNLTRAFEDPEFLEAFRLAGLDDLDAQIGRCLSFELDFDSTIYTDNGVLQSTSHVRAEGIKIQFAPGGELKSESYPLQYVSFETRNIAEGACEVGSFETIDGTFKVIGGALKINQNQLSLTLQIEPLGATENLIFACPLEEVPVPNFIHWRTHFALMHGSQQLEIDRFAIPDWKFTGNDGHFAEAIYESNFSAGSSQIDETTFLVLVHTPQP